MSLERALLRTFARASGLRTHHTAITWLDGKYKRIEFDGIDRFGNTFHTVSGGIKSSALFRAATLLGQEQRLKSVRQFTKQVFPESKSPMAKPSEFSRRYTEFAKNVEKRTDELLARLDAATKKAPDAFGRANALLDQNDAEMDAMESELGQLSNLPPLVK